MSAWILLVVEFSSCRLTLCLLGFFLLLTLSARLCTGIVAVAALLKPQQLKHLVASVASDPIRTSYSIGWNIRRSPTLRFVTLVATFRRWVKLRNQHSLLPAFGNGRKSSTVMMDLQFTKMAIFIDFHFLLKM